MLNGLPLLVGWFETMMSVTAHLDSFWHEEKAKIPLCNRARQFGKRNIVPMSRSSQFAEEKLCAMWKFPGGVPRIQRGIPTPYNTPIPQFRPGVWATLPCERE